MAPRRILILEDEALIAMELESRLRSCGYEVLGPASTAAQALQILEAQQPDLLLADVRISGSGDGITVAEVARDRWQIPSVFLTAHMDLVMRQRALTAAPLGYLTKPIRELELLAMIEVALHRASLERALAAERAALRESEGRWQALVECLPDALLVVDEDGRIVRVNAGAERLFGRDRAALLAMSIEDLVPETARTAHGAMRRAFNADPRTRTMAGDRVVHAVLAGGAVGPVEVRLSKADDGGRPVVVAAVRDVRDRLQAQQRSQEQKVQLLRAEKFEALGRLAGGVAHDLNNILMVALGVMSELQSVAREGHGLFAELDDALRRAQALSRRLLGVARRPQGNPQAIDVGAAVAAFARSLERIVGNDITRDVHVEEPLSPVWIDPVELDQVLLNLVTNAVKAMPDGGRLTIRACALGDDVGIVVEDTGVGMSEETAARIFEPFFTTRSDDGGHGLGLATVWTIVHHAGGEISVTSTPGAGTRFDVRFPAFSGAGAEAKTSSPCPS